MKSISAYLLVIITCCSPIILISQIDESGNSYYVVIGAYAHEENAQRFMKWAQSAGFNPKYEKNESKNLFYVYTLRENNWGIPVQEAERIRKAFPKLDDTWVYHGKFPNSTPVTLTENISPPSEEVEVVSASAGNPVVLAAPVVKNLSKKFYFKLIPEDGKNLNAPVEIVDLDSSKLHALYPTNEIVTIKPINASGRIMVQSKVFGYRLKQIGIDFDSPTDSAGITLDSGRYWVPVELKLLQEGDISTMYNVFFFKDASVMRPDSKYEINALLAMMNEFPSRKIIVHGHTNGTWYGKMLLRGEKKDFFSIDDCVVSKGSAIELSKLRAHCIVDYLVANGINSDRMTVKPWGGKRPLFHHAHERAIDNVRVEVEIAKSNPKL